MMSVARISYFLHHFFLLGCQENLDHKEVTAGRVATPKVGPDPLGVPRRNNNANRRPDLQKHPRSDDSKLRYMPLQTKS